MLDAAALEELELELELAVSVALFADFPAEVEVPPELADEDGLTDFNVALLAPVVDAVLAPVALEEAVEVPVAVAPDAEESCSLDSQPLLAPKTGK